MKRKHRVIVEITTSKPLTEKDSVQALQLTLDSRLDLQRQPIWAYDNSPYINKLRVKAFSRVLQAVR